MLNYFWNGIVNAKIVWIGIAKIFGAGVVIEFYGDWVAIFGGLR